MINTKIHWKILIPFVLVPTLCFGLFTPIYLDLLNHEVTSKGLIFPLGIFGTLGMWLTLTLILRTKKVTLTDYTITIKRVFTFSSFEYKKKDIVAFDVIFQSNQLYDYLILQFKTNDNKIHSIVSYELTSIVII